MTHSGVCPCPNCVGGARGGGLLAALVEMALLAAAGLLVLVARFCSGRLLWRRRGPCDARWLAPAPPQAPPPRRAGVAGAPVPRSHWARRPGWHRQVVRLGVTALAVGLWAAPVVTVAALAGAALTAAALLLAARRGAIPALERRDPAWAVTDASAAGWLDDDHAGVGALLAPVPATALRLDREDLTYAAGDVAGFGGAEPIGLPSRSRPRAASPGRPRVGAP